jgi:hypothetical protein
MTSPGPPPGRGPHSAAGDAAEQAQLSAAERALAAAEEQALAAAVERERLVSPLADADERGNRAGAVERERLVSPLVDADERAIEGALRPKRLAEVIGQNRVREQLSLVLEGALRRGRAPDHVLLSGPPGWARPRSR